MIPEKPYVVVTVRGRSRSERTVMLDKIEAMLTEAGLTTFGFSGSMSSTAVVDSLASSAQSDAGPAVVLIDDMDVLDQRDHLLTLQGAMTRITKVSDVSEQE